MSQEALESEQEELLARMVEADASVPRERRGGFILAEAHDGSHLVHPALQNNLVAARGDLDALAEAGLLRASAGSQGSPRYDVTNRGRSYVATATMHESSSGTGTSGVGPSVFFSYAHEDGAIARALAQRLHERGLRVWIDEGELRVGDSLIERIATAITEMEYMVALVSPASAASQWCRKELALAITGGLGREHVKVLPLRVGEVEMPPALQDVYYLPVDPNDVGGVVERLIADIGAHHRERTEGVVPAPPAPSTRQEPAGEDSSEWEPITIIGVVEEGVGKPKNDGTRGSALYRVPLRLSRKPPTGWANLFQQTWHRPPSFSTMHRPGIARVVGDTVVLDGTTIEELEQVHVRTLRLVLNKVNEEYTHAIAVERERRSREEAERKEHEERVQDVSKRLRFD